MTDKRLFLAVAPLALLAACGKGSDEERAASGEVLQGTISDAMLPVDQVRSEPPLEDPEAFAEATSDTEKGPGDKAQGDAEGEAPDRDGAETDAAPTPAANPEVED